MNSLFLAPHDDDQALFGAFTCLREKPLVCIITDSQIQPKRGEIGCSKEERSAETLKANDILGCQTLRLGLDDDTVTEQKIEDLLRGISRLFSYVTVYAPALQGGNIHHDMVSRAATRIWGKKVVYYSTYTKDELYTTGQTEVIPTKEELELKNKALACYKSQILINKPHFDAVEGKSEWLTHQKTQLKKVFLITMFGSPFSWIQDYVDNVQHLEKYGWYWKIFTPHPIESKGNVEIVPMTTDQFNDLVETKLGIRPNLYATEKGIPSVHMTDFYVASGVIFEDYIKDADFWGITNLDVVYGRLDKFIPDVVLNQVSIFTDDVDGVINGVFSLYRNDEKTNNLFREIPEWEKKLSLPPCPRCIGTGDRHVLAGTDEFDLTDVVKKLKPAISYPNHYPLHGHDRLEMHVPDVKLEIKSDGSLWELTRDVNGPTWIHARPFIGREIPYFHFIRTKEWPKCLKK